MSHRAAARLAGSLLALYVVLSAAGIALLAASPGDPAAPSTVFFEVVFGSVLLVFAAVGAVVASRRPENPIGWLFCALAIFNGVWLFAYGYASYALFAAPGSLPGGRAAALSAQLLETPPPAILMFLLLLFPTGGLPGPRWRVLAVVIVVWIGVVNLQLAVTPGRFELMPSVENPVGSEALEPLTRLGLFPVGIVLFVAAFASLAVRFRRARGVERQQLKWFVFFASLVAFYLVLGAIAEATLPESRLADYVFGTLFALLIAGVPISVGLAVLRYRLYEIDRIVNRALVYGLLTATLALTYVGSVLLLQLLLRPLTEESDLAIAGSTLAVAALFRPARSRFQRAVDHRFYRRKYDAIQTLESFSARLRDELDIDALAAELRGVVRETMQPAHVSLWLREAGR